MILQFNRYRDPETGALGPLVRSDLLASEFSIPLNDHGEILAASVKILDADLCNDRIRTELRPEGYSGPFVLGLAGSTDQGVVALKLVEEARSGKTAPYEDSFHVETLPLATFSGLRAIWQVEEGFLSHDLKYGFKNLGKYRHSQYNTPDEADVTCQTGGQVNVCFATPEPTCDYSPGQMYSTFKTQVDRNGNGRTASHGLVLASHGCPAGPSSCPGKTYREVSAIAGRCGGADGTGRVDDTTVAVGDDNPDKLGCGDKICTFGVRTDGKGLLKTITDRCPDCSGKKQLDNYTSESGVCSGSRRIVDLSPSALTFKLIVGE